MTDQENNNQSIDRVKSYWVGRSTGEYRCPNISLFRFLNAIGFKIVEKTILEVGFGHGADLLECKRRGGIVYGLDLNQQAIEDLSELNNSHKAIFRAGVDRIPFGTTFDFIYA